MSGERVCPTCGKPVIEMRWRPFCSARCKQVDLGRWLTESYVLPGADGDALVDPDADE